MSPPSPQPRLLVFARAPVPGQAKTRLIPALGPDKAAALQGALMEHTLKGSAPLRAVRRELWCSPDAKHPALREAAQRHGLIAQVQQGPDLGARMHHALGHALKDAPAAVLIGTDCPDLGAPLLEAAFAALAAGRDLVLGPAVDGGYYLVGLRRPCAALFEGINWGGAGVLARTRVRADGAGLDRYELPSLRDIDRPEDLAALPQSLITEESPSALA
jgi:rSAM/selenodomain-associated transferase 1